MISAERRMADLERLWVEYRRLDEEWDAVIDADGDDSEAARRATEAEDAYEAALTEAAGGAAIGPVVAGVQLAAIKAAIDEDDEITALAMSDDGTAVAVGTASGQTLVFCERDDDSTIAWSNIWPNWYTNWKTVLLD
jgi:hypothetical protein